MKNDHQCHELWSSALRLIERRPHSKKELKDKLLLKYPSEEDAILKVMEEMERVHLLSEQRFAEVFLAHLTQKNVGRLKIMHETKQKGLSIDLAEQVLLDLSWSEEAAVKKAIEEKARALEGLEERKKKQKLMHFLRNRGFSDRVVYSLLSSSSIS